VSAVTTDEHTTVVGPVELGGVTYRLEIPSFAIEPGVEITMTPVTLEGLSADVVGAFKFGPSGTEFLVPATLRAEGVPDMPISALRVDDSGIGAIASYTPNGSGIAEISVEHFSVVSFFLDINTLFPVGAAGTAQVPFDDELAVPVMADIYNQTVVPKAQQAGASLRDFVIAMRLFEEWNAALQRRGTIFGRERPASLGGLSLSEARSDVSDLLAEKARDLFNQLSRPSCNDVTRRLFTPTNWIEVLVFLSDKASTLSGGGIELNNFAPCVTLSFPQEVLEQGDIIARTERQVDVALQLLATSPRFTQPIRAEFRVTLTGALQNGMPSFPASPDDPRSIHEVPVFRAEDCFDRPHTVTAHIEGNIFGIVGVDPKELNFDVTPAVADITWTDIGLCPCFDTTPSPAVPGALPGPPQEDSQCLPGAITTMNGTIIPANDAIQTIVPANTGPNTTDAPLPLGVVFFANRVDAVVVCSGPPTQMANTAYVEVLITGAPNATELALGDYTFSDVNTMVPNSFTAFVVGIEQCTVLPDGTQACQCGELGFRQFDDGALTLSESGAGLVGELTLVGGTSTSTGFFALPTCRPAFADAAIDSGLRECIPNGS
jgi:hypothetical protein